MVYYLVFRGTQLSSNVKLKLVTVTVLRSGNTDNTAPPSLHCAVDSNPTFTICPTGEVTTRAKYHRRTHRKILKPANVIFIKNESV